MTGFFKSVFSLFLSTLIVLTSPDVFSFLVEPPVPVVSSLKVEVIPRSEMGIVTDAKGNVHRVTEITRLDGNGNQIERQVIDRFTFRDDRGKKVKAQIVSLYNADDRLIKVGESYKQKVKKGTAITKRTTVYDPETGDILSQKTKQDFKKSGFFNSTAGKILGIALVIGLAIIAPYIAAALLNTTVGAMGLGALAISAGIGAGIGQFAVSLAQGASFKDALIAGAITFAATAVAVYLGPQIGALLGNIPHVGAGLTAIKTGLSAIGSKIGSFFGATTGGAAAGTIAERLTVGTFFQQFIPQFSLRLGSDVLSQTFGKNLGVFGTVAVLSVLGTFANSAIGGITNHPISLTAFGDNFANSIFSGILQGGVAEALKNESGLGAQFLREFGSTFAGSLQLTKIAAAYNDAIKGVNRVNEIIRELGYEPEDVRSIKVLPDRQGIQLTLKDKIREDGTVLYDATSANSSLNRELSPVERLTIFATKLYDYATVERTFVIGFGGAQNYSQGLSKYVGINGFNFGAPEVSGGNPMDFIGDGSGIPGIVQSSGTGALLLNQQAYERSSKLNILAQDSGTRYTFEQEGVEYQRLNPFLKTPTSVVTEFYSPNQAKEALNLITTYAKSGDPINLVAHSIGAPDLEYLVTQLNQIRPDLRINSITLIDPVMIRDFRVPANVDNVTLFYQTQDLTNGVLRPKDITILNNNRTNFQTFEVQPPQFNRPADASEYSYHEHIDNLYSINYYLRNFIEEGKRQQYGIY